MADVKEFTVDRSRWYRGKGGDGSMLRNAEGCQCCLGFLGEACNVPDDLLNLAPLPVAPGNGPRGSSEWPAWLFNCVGALCSQVRDRLAGYNDNELIPDSTREALITAECASHGVTVHFVDGPVSP